MSIISMIEEQNNSVGHFGWGWGVVVNIQPLCVSPIVSFYELTVSYRYHKKKTTKMYIPDDACCFSDAAGRAALQVTSMEYR